MRAVTRASSAAAVPSGFQLVRVATAELLAKASPSNPRTIDDHELSALRRSLRVFSAVQPIVVNRRTNRVVGGHQRIRAAGLEGIVTLPVVYVDLDDAAERQLNLALNRIGGTWDEEKLAAVIADLTASGADLALTGFTGDEIEEFRRLAAGAVEGLTDPDDIPAPPDIPVTRLGDLIQLGEHLLLCGDAGDAVHVDRLCAAGTARLVNTDPPLCCGCIFCRVVDLNDPETYRVIAEPTLIAA